MQGLGARGILARRQGVPAVQGTDAEEHEAFAAFRQAEEEGEAAGRQGRPVEGTIGKERDAAEQAAGSKHPFPHHTRAAPKLSKLHGATVMNMRLPNKTTGQREKTRCPVCVFKDDSVLHIVRERIPNHTAASSHSEAESLPYMIQRW